MLSKKEYLTKNAAVSKKLRKYKQLFGITVENLETS